MQTLVGLRFIRAMASFGDEVPTYAKGAPSSSRSVSAHENKGRAVAEATRLGSLPR